MALARLRAGDRGGAEAGAHPVHQPREFKRRIRAAVQPVLRRGEGLHRLCRQGDEIEAEAGVQPFQPVAPQAQQFVESERVLAQLDTLRPIGPPERSAPALAVAVAQADAERATSADLRRVAMTTIDGPVFR